MAKEKKEDPRTNILRTIVGKDQELRDAFSHQMHAAVGKALGAWVHLEGSLSSLLANYLDQNNNARIAALWWSVHSIENRLKCIDRVVAVYDAETDAHGKRIKDWKQLRKRVLRLQETRNKLAHGAVVHRGTTESGEHFSYVYFEPFPLESRILPSVTATKQRQKGVEPNFEVPPPGSLGLVEIDDFFWSVVKTQREVGRLAQQIWDSNNASPLA